MIAFRRSIARRIPGRLFGGWSGCVGCPAWLMLGLALGLITAESARAEAPIQLLGQWGGPSRAVAMSGDVAVVGAGHRLVMLDISQPANPVVLGRTDLLPEVVVDVAVAGDYAYVASAWAGLLIINVADAAAPALVSRYDTDGYAQGLAVEGDRVYLADGDEGLVIINVADPTAPFRDGALDTAGYARDVKVVGQYAYVADGPDDLRIVDVSDAAAPWLVGGVNNLPDDAVGLDVVGDYVYLAEGYSGGLQIVHVADPTVPLWVGSCATDGGAGDVAVSGNLAYVANGWLGLAVVDVTDPALPSKIGELDTDGWAERLAVGAGVAMVADHSQGMQILDLSAAPSLARLGEYREACGETTDLNAADNLVYLADGSTGGGIQVLDVADPAAPVRLGSVFTQEYAWGLTLAGSSAYLADGCAGFGVVDVSDPANPQRRGQAATGCAARDTVVQGDYAYVALDGGHGLRVVDIADPDTPGVVGQWEDSVNPGYALGVAVAGSYAYLADDGQGLQIIDVSDPMNPAKVGNFVTSGSAYDVAVVGELAYVAADWAGLLIVDVSDPANPALVGQFSEAGSASGVAIQGRYAVVACWGLGVFIVDVSDPAAPVRVGWYDTPGYARRVAVDGDSIFVADDDNGLMILRAPILSAFSWNNPYGGPFDEPTNWTPEGPPGSLAPAFFALPDTYTVTMPADADVTIDQILQNAGDVQLDLNGRTLGLLHAWDGLPSVAIGNDPYSSTDARLTVFGGTVRSREVEIGRWGGSSGSLALAGVDWLADESSLGIGVVGSGALTVSDEGTVVAGLVTVGTSAGADGAVGIDGLGWVNLTGSNEVNLIVGGAGQGAVTVQSGGRIDNEGQARVAGRSGSYGVLTIQDAGQVEQTGEFTVGLTEGAVGEVLVAGAESSFVVHNHVEVGGYVANSSGGSGTLTVRDGAYFAGEHVRVGDAAGSVGEVVVEGSDSLLEIGSTLSAGNHSQMEIGVRGAGTVTVRDGGRVTVYAYPDGYSGLTILGGGDWPVADLIVSGSEAVYTSNAQIQVGRNTVGRVRVAAGGRLESYVSVSTTGSSGIIAMTAGVPAEVVVTGAGSRWVQDGALTVGWFGEGNLDVQTSGLVECREAIIGRMAGSVGQTTVTGSGSSWTVAGSLTIGGLPTAAGGEGQLVVSDNALVTVGETLRIWAGSTVDLTGGRVTVGSGAAALPGTLAVYEGGAVMGSGSIEGSVHNVGGVVAPGMSLGVLSVQGGFVQDEFGTLEIEVAGSEAGTGYDRLAVTGSVVLEGTLRVRSLDGYLPAIGDRFTIVTGAAVAGRFAAVEGGLIGAGLRLVPEYNLSNVTLVVTESALGDRDGDGDVDLEDYAGLAECLFGPEVAPAPPAPLTAAECLAAFDFEADGDVDLVDFAAFEEDFTGSLP